MVDIFFCLSQGGECLRRLHVVSIEKHLTKPVKLLIPELGETHESSTFASEWYCIGYGS
jgi:hypothetical protein